LNFMAECGQARRPETPGESHMSKSGLHLGRE
jgi:hypothetical protein